ncbi:MAG: DUF6377 domain-containing protein [Bacteroidales bacterium]
MKRILLLNLFILYNVLVFGKDIFHQNNEIALQKLDSLIQINDEFIKEKVNRLKQLKKNASTGLTDEIYWKNKQIYQEYKTFDSDSALVWLDNLDKLATKNQYKDELVRNKIERACLLAATGLLVESFKVFEGIKPSELSGDLAKLYYGNKAYLYSHLHQYATCHNTEIKPGMVHYYQAQQLSCIDSVQRMNKPGDEDYLWNLAWKYRETDSLAYYRQKLERNLEKSTFSDRKDAMLLYALGHLYSEEKDMVGKINALAYSAMADLRCANREIASLQELGQLLFQTGDIDRTYRYINLCLKNAQIYKARIRAVEIANIMDAVYSRNMARDAEREKKLEAIFIGLMIITLIAIVAIIIIAFQFLKLRKSNQALATSNNLLNANVTKLTLTQRELEEVNLQLKNLNQEMLEANLVKEEYIGHVFNLCSNYLSKMDEHHKRFKKRMRAGAKEDLSAMADVPLNIDQEVKEFYHNFDAVFLNLYPDFIDEFNKLLRPEERIVLKTNELLNTELRIYALVRLGINDSTKIAEFLRISTQTVYNNRLRIRNKSIVSKDEFTILIRKLGNINIST